MQGYLNTSHVTVQLNTPAVYVRSSVEFKYISCYGSTLNDQTKRIGHRLFKYISCYGSTMAHIHHKRQQSNLNTSHVTVQHFIKYSNICRSIYLNTSHVTVQHKEDITSYNTMGFKYISCYGSTGEIVIDAETMTKFKYISCYGSTPSNYSYVLSFDIFKYISCYGSTTCTPSNCCTYIGI